MPTAQVNGHKVNYRQAGEGEDLILIHGLAANHAFWNLVLLLPLARQYKVTVYDLRGHGYSDTLSHGYTSADLSADLTGLMNRLDIPKAHLVGHSFGGVVAMHSAVLHPDRVQSLTIADSRLRALQPSQRLRDWPDWRTAKADLEKAGITIDENEDNIGLRLLEIFASPQWRATRKRSAKKGLFVPFGGWSAGSRSAARWLKLLETTTVRQDVTATAGLTLDRIKTVQIPTLALYGERSRCMHTCTAMQEVLLHCKVVIVPGTGHFYPVIKPAFVAETLLDFLDEVARSSSRPIDKDCGDDEETAAA
ncbi:MAG: alpha/beta hydrolase [Planctomycetota bacterium]